MATKPAYKPAHVCAVTGEPATRYVADPDYGTWVREKIWLSDRAYAAMCELTLTAKLPETRAEILAAIRDRLT